MKISINNLFISEVKKYNIAKFLNKEVLGTHIENVKARASEIKVDDLFTTNSDFKLDDNTVKQIIKSLSIKEKEGTGFILVAERLNKLQNKGYYHVVFFDIKSRDIIDTWKADGKARGFGLRNYWAGSVYSVLKNMKLK